MYSHQQCIRRRIHRSRVSSNMLAWKGQTKIDSIASSLINKIFTMITRSQRMPPSQTNYLTIKCRSRASSRSQISKCKTSPCSRSCRSFSKSSCWPTIRLAKAVIWVKIIWRTAWTSISYQINLEIKSKPSFNRLKDREHSVSPI